MGVSGKLAVGLTLLVSVGAALAARLGEAVPGPGPVLTLQLHCGTHEVHWWQRSTNLADWTTFQRSATGGSNRTLPVALTNFSATGHYFRTLQTNEPLFAYGLAAREFIDLNGNNLTADSFDSANPAFSTNGRWDVPKRRDGANLSVGTTLSNAPLPDYTALLTVWGNCYLQSTGSVSVGSGKIGNPAWQIGGAAGIQPGHLIQDWPVVHPEVVLPAGSENWPLLTPAPATNTYAYVLDQTGDYYFPTGELSGKISVTAPNVRLRVDGSIRLTGQDCLFFSSSNASLTLYMNGASAQLTGQGIINFYRPTNFVYFGTASNVSLAVGGNGEVTGVFYAPSAVAYLHGGGASDQDFSGAFVARSVRLTGHYHFHFDEDLLRRFPR